jgi:hypothetical protein
MKSAAGLDWTAAGLCICSLWLLKLCLQLHNRTAHEGCQWGGRASGVIYVFTFLFNPVLHGTMAQTVSTRSPTLISSSLHQ